MTAKLITVEGSKIKIELTLELSRSMLDTEINIQKSLNEVGCIASKEALKYLTQWVFREVKQVNFVTKKSTGFCHSFGSYGQNQRNPNIRAIFSEKFPDGGVTKSAKATKILPSC